MCLALQNVALISIVYPRCRINPSFGPFAGSNMKTKTTFVTMLALLLASCSLLGSPTATVKKFMAAAQKGDAEAMTQLFSKKAQQKIGLETIQANNKQFS